MRLTRLGTMNSNIYHKKTKSCEIPVEHIKEKLEILHNLHHDIVCKLNSLSISHNQVKIQEVPKPIPVLVRDWEFGFPGARCHISRSQFYLKYCHILNKNGYIDKFPKQNDIKSCMLRSIGECKFLKDDIESLSQEIEKMTNILSTLKV